MINTPSAQCPDGDTRRGEGEGGGEGGGVGGKGWQSKKLHHDSRPIRQTGVLMSEKWEEREMILHFQSWIFSYSTFPEESLAPRSYPWYWHARREEIDFLTEAISCQHLSLYTWSNIQRSVFVNESVLGIIFYKIIPAQGDIVGGQTGRLGSYQSCAGRRKCLI